MVIIRQEQQKTEHTSFVLVQRSVCGVVYDQIGACVQPYVLGLKNTFNKCYDELVKRTDIIWGPLGRQRYLWNRSKQFGNIKEIQTLPPSGSTRASKTSISGADLPTYEPSEFTGPG